MILTLGIYTACGPSGGGQQGESSSDTSGAIVETTSSDGPVATASDAGTSGTTSPECADIYEGDLSINDETDLSALAQTGQVTGYVIVASTDFVDLTFLSCLREVGGLLRVRSNDSLESLTGLERLEIVEEIWITGNDKLVDISALGSVKTVEELNIWGNLELSELGFDGLETAWRIQLGECGDDPSETPRDYVPALTEINGFANLTSVTTFRVAGQTELVSLGRLHEIGAAGGVEYVGIYNNHKLPYAEVEQLEQQSGVDVGACGCVDDPEPLCSESSQFPSECTAPPP